MTNSDSEFNFPSAYADGYKTARAWNQGYADRYMMHTTIGDSQLDPIVEELQSLSARKLHRLVKATIEGNKEVLKKKAPRELQIFAEEIEVPPSWYSYSKCEDAIRSFHRNTDFILVAFVSAVLIEGFSTLIAKSFNMTGRVAMTPETRLKRNNRHLIEVFFPGGVQRYGDGWKYSVRIRFVHAQVRALMKDYDDWNASAWGTPISAAHVGFAICVFSMRLLIHSKAIGASYTQADKDSFMHIWRYAGHLMGIPDEILFTDYDDAVNIYKTGLMCEPPPDEDCAAMSNALIKSAPTVANITDEKRIKEIENLVYTLSRAFIGKELANQLQFPKTRTFLVLQLYRINQLIQRKFKNIDTVKSNNFETMLSASYYGDKGISYKMPDHVLAKHSSPW